MHFLHEPGRGGLWASFTYSKPGLIIKRALFSYSSLTQNGLSWPMSTLNF